MNVFKLNQWALMGCFILSLLVMGCDEAYYNGPIESGKIELDFQNTAWYIENNPNLGVILINEDDTFCMDKTLAERIYFYPKMELGSYKKAKICGKFKFDETKRIVHFDILGHSHDVPVFRSPTDVYFMPVTLDNIGGQETFLLQKK